MMKMSHALHAIGRVLRCQSKALRVRRIGVAPPAFSMDERYPFAAPRLDGSMAIRLRQIYVRTADDAPPIKAGWSYLSWRHFAAHILVAGWPKLGSAVAAGNVVNTPTHIETSSLEHLCTNKGEGMSAFPAKLLEKLRQHNDMQTAPVRLPKTPQQASDVYPDKTEVKCADHLGRGEPR